MRGESLGAEDNFPASRPPLALELGVREGVWARRSLCVLTPLGCLLPAPSFWAGSSALCSTPHPQQAAPLASCSNSPPGPCPDSPGEPSPPSHILTTPKSLLPASSPFCSLDSHPAACPTCPLGSRWLLRLRRAQCGPFPCPPVWMTPTALCLPPIFGKPSRKHLLTPDPSTTPQR